MNSNILKNKNCLITGATGGLGKEIAVELVKCGCNLFLTGKQEKKLEKLKGDINQYIKNNSVQYQHTDLLNSNELNYLIKKIRAKFNSIDILINCAGIFPVNPISKNSLDEYDTCMNLNVRAPFVLAKEFSKDMVKNEWGRIVNIASSGAYNGLKNTTIYLKNAKQRNPQKGSTATL